MNKLTALCVTVISAIALTGCTSFRSSVPEASLGLGMNTTATYDVLGDARGTATGATLFGFIPIGGERKAGAVGGMMLMGPVEQAAVYNAIESVPNADSLVWPRFHIETSNYIIYSERTVTVKGKAIRFNPSAK